MATSIFAPVSRANKPLVEFRAGKMNIRGTTVTADKRKGLVQVVQSPDDNLIHFKWKDRTTGIQETDLIIFPEEATYKRIKQATTGRVYLLEWKTTARKMFFWMQEPSEDKDEEYCTKINQYINNPPASNAGGASAAGIDQNQLFQMMAGGRRAHAPVASPTPSATPSAGTGASASPAARAAPSGDAGVSQSLLQNILSGLGVQPGAAAPAQQQPQRREREDTNLEYLMTPEALLPILSNPDVQRQLFPHLPEGHRTPEELMQLVHSPQFQQALQSLNTALQSGQLSDLMPHFGLPASVGGPNGGVDALLRALQEQARNVQRQQGAEAAQQGEKMDVDTEVPPLVDDDKKEKKDEKKEGDDKDKPTGS